MTLLTRLRRSPVPQGETFTLFGTTQHTRSGDLCLDLPRIPRTPVSKFQHRRIGPNPSVCTNDVIPFRANYASSHSKGVQWASLIPNSAQVLDRSVDLTIGLLNMAHVTILVGGETYEMVKTRLESDPSKELHRFYLPIDALDVFGEKPHILAIRCKAIQQIENLSFV